MNQNQRAFDRVNAFIAGGSPEDVDLRVGIGEDVVLDEKKNTLQHFRIHVKVSHPNHPVPKSRKKIHIRKAAVLAYTPEEAKKKALIHYRKHGYRTHEIEHVNEGVIAENFKMTYEKGSWEPGHHHILHTHLDGDDLKTSPTPERTGYLVKHHPHHKKLLAAGWRIHTYGSHKHPAFGHTQVHTNESFGAEMTADGTMTMPKPWEGEPTDPGNSPKTWEKIREALAGRR